MSTPDEQIQAQRRVFYHHTIQERHLIGPEELAQLFQDKEQMLAKINELEQQLVEARNDATSWANQSDSFAHELLECLKRCDELEAAEKLRLDEARKAATWRT